MRAQLRLAGDHAMSRMTRRAPHGPRVVSVVVVVCKCHKRRHDHICRLVSLYVQVCLRLHDDSTPRRCACVVAALDACGPSPSRGQRLRSPSVAVRFAGQLNDLRTPTPRPRSGKRRRRTRRRMGPCAWSTCHPSTGDYRGGLRASSCLGSARIMPTE